MTGIDIGVTGGTKLFRKYDSIIEDGRETCGHLASIRRYVIASDLETGHHQFHNRKPHEFIALTSEHTWHLGTD